MLTIILLLLALVCFVIAAFGWALGRVNLIAAGLALITLNWFLDALGVIT